VLTSLENMPGYIRWAETSQGKYYVDGPARFSFWLGDYGVVKDTYVRSGMFPSQPVIDNADRR
jgi:hypothetical protein